MLWEAPLELEWGIQFNEGGLVAVHTDGFLSITLDNSSLLFECDGDVNIKYFIKLPYGNIIRLARRGTGPVSIFDSSIGYL